jgi:hypothetical protein
MAKTHLIIGGFEVATPTILSPFQKSIRPRRLVWFPKGRRTTSRTARQKGKGLGWWGSSKELVKYSFRSFEHHSIAYEFAISNNPAVGFPH